MARFQLPLDRLARVADIAVEFAPKVFKTRAGSVGVRLNDLSPKQDGFDSVARMILDYYAVDGVVKEIP